MFVGSGEVLGEYIRRQPGVLGFPVIEKFGEQLPFLFKVLSVNQALSIQAHPNKVNMYIIYVGMVLARKYISEHHNHSCTNYIIFT